MRIAIAGSVFALDVMRTKTAGAYRVALHVLPAEPFFSKEEEVVVAKHGKNGMAVQGGAAPVMPDSASHPNYHLVVHVFRKRGRQAMRQ